MQKISYLVPGISCYHCVRTIITELTDLEGVDRIEADADTKVVTVYYTVPTTQDQIEKKLEEINYPAKRL